MRALLALFSYTAHSGNLPGVSYFRVFSLTPFTQSAQTAAVRRFDPRMALTSLAAFLPTRSSSAMVPTVMCPVGPQANTWIDQAKRTNKHVRHTTFFIVNLHIRRSWQSIASRGRRSQRPHSGLEIVRDRSLCDFETSRSQADSIWHFKNHSGVYRGLAGCCLLLYAL